MEMEFETEQEYLEEDELTLLQEIRKHQGEK